MVLKSKDCVLRIGNYIHSKPFFFFSNQAECTFLRIFLNSVKPECFSVKIGFRHKYSNKHAQLRMMKRIFTFDSPGFIGYIVVCEEGRL